MITSVYGTGFFIGITQQKERPYNCEAKNRFQKKQPTLGDGKISGQRGAAMRAPDARWGRKGKKSVFGYKIHTGVDAGHTIIRRIHVTDASVTDTEPADRLFCGDEKVVYGDQAYFTHARHARLTEAGIKDRLMRRPNKHHPNCRRGRSSVTG